jgi:hypothetical protein
MLGIYGPEAAEVRRESRTLIEEQMRRLWPGEVTLPAQLKSDAPTGDAFYVAIQGLSPRDNAQRALKAQAVALAVELAQHRSLMLAQSISPFRRRCWSYLRIAIAVPELLQERLLSPLPFHHSKLASLSCGTRHEDVG